MKVFVTGISGQLGYDVARTLKQENIAYLGVSSKELDITDSIAVRRMIENYRPDAVIHCAAWTAVDKAEENEERVMAVNVGGTRIIAEVCRDIDAKMLYISTDYVFPGTGERFYEVDDFTGPVNVYGRSKLAGERVVQELLERYFIVRISWVFGKNGNNFVRTMLRLARSNNEIKVVYDQIGSPTYTADLAPLLCEMVQTDKYGIYHATNEGVCSWAEFAQEVFKKSSLKRDVIPIKDYPSVAMRPNNSRISKQSLDKNGFKRLPTWQDALVRMLKEVDWKS